MVRVDAAGLRTTYKYERGGHVGAVAAPSGARTCAVDDISGGEGSRGRVPA